MLSRTYDSEHIYPNALEHRQLGQTSVTLRPFGLQIVRGVERWSKFLVHITLMTNFPISAARQTIFVILGLKYI
jgi:hypothetical protein